MEFILQAFILIWLTLIFVPTIVAGLKQIEYGSDYWVLYIIGIIICLVIYIGAVATVINNPDIIINRFKNL